MAVRLWCWNPKPDKQSVYTGHVLAIDLDSNCEASQSNTNGGAPTVSVSLTLNLDSDLNLGPNLDLDADRLRHRPSPHSLRIALGHASAAARPGRKSLEYTGFGSLAQTVRLLFYFLYATLSQSSNNIIFLLRGDIPSGIQGDAGFHIAFQRKRRCISPWLLLLVRVDPVLAIPRSRCKSSVGYKHIV